MVSTKLRDRKAIANESGRLIYEIIGDLPLQHIKAPLLIVVISGACTLRNPLKSVRFESPNRRVDSVCFSLQTLGFIGEIYSHSLSAGIICDRLLG